ncbi:hypothetical protein A6E19_19900 [Pseudomonas putida]|nr:hypothetical protein A6E20_16140 [Pseudomonas putida]OCT26398.1 hypothetical protein A6E23_12500 [Pseudomonas putida]OCT37277.1 hypothetical protein A6E19_19900 [Pseudomonas putida]
MGALLRLVLFRPPSLVACIERQADLTGPFGRLQGIRVIGLSLTRSFGNTLVHANGGSMSKPCADSAHLSEGEACTVTKRGWVD